jgi:hypothetical protein
MLIHHVNRVVCFGAVLAALTLAMPAMAVSAEMSGMVSAVSGPVKIRAKGSVQKVVVGQKVEESDRLETGAGGMVQVRYETGDSFTVYEKASVEVSEYRVQSGKTAVVQSAVDVAYGKLRFFVNPKGQVKKNVKYRSKSAVMGIRGTSGVIDVDRSGSTQLHVITGQVEVFNPKFPDVKVPVEALKMTRIVSTEAPTPPAPVTAATLQGLVPPPPAGAGFSDDSAKASDTYQELTPKQPKSPDSESQPNQPPSGVQDEEQGTQEGVETPSAKPIESEQKETAAPELKQGSNATPVPAPRVRRSVTVFNPGGDVAQSDAPPDVNLKVAPDAPRRSEEGQVPGSEQDSSVNSSKASAAIELQVDPVASWQRVRTKVDKVVTSTTRIVEDEKSQTLKTTPAARRVIIKIPLPND